MRRKTTEVKIGNITVASSAPVMLQSMLNTPTLDTEACIEQAIRIIEAGGQLVRITAQGVKEAENLKNIHAGLRARGYTTPLSADIHFHPEAASIAARYVEKVRINPGNFADKQASLQNQQYTDTAYREELEHLKSEFTVFLDVCRKNNTAVRIGTNHGSLSGRIMHRYGNTPEGMVEATLEYLRICRDTDFRNVVVSLKSSDCRVMIDAVRLLVRRMEEEQLNYPLHLGVTEAGEGEDGRIRSAVGIGTLLNEGIGDTIRVSLTEAPEHEIPVARTLVEICHPIYKQTEHPTTGEENRPIVVADISHVDVLDECVSRELGFSAAGNDPVYGELLTAGPQAPEMIYTEALGPELTKLPQGITVIVPYSNLDMAHIYNRNACPLMSAEEFRRSGACHTRFQFVCIRTSNDVDDPLSERLKESADAVVVVSPARSDYHEYRNILQALRNKKLANKVIIKADITGNSSENSIRTAAHTGGIFVDRLAYGLWISAQQPQNSSETLELSRNMLQAAGVRRYKTEFISCPGCGRTLFDLQSAVNRAKAAFSHLSHLKIAIMGCIVNGPGEMGDADYGYVGAGNGKVNLYKGKQMVKAGIDESEAIEALKGLITEEGDWREV